MNEENPKKNKADILRQRAEETLEALKKKVGVVNEKLTPNVQKLIHELEVHQIELEMQNDELRNAKLKIEETSSKNFELYNFAPVGYLTLNEKGFIKELNLTAATLLGENRNDLIDKQFNRYIKREDRDIFYLHLGKVNELGKNYCELSLKKKDGTEFYGYLECLLVPNEKEALLKYKIVLIDITERKNHEEKLRESEKKYRNLINLAQEGIWVIDESNITSFVNPSMAKMLRYAAEEMLGKPLYHFMDEAGIKVANENLERRKAGLKEQHDFEFICKDGDRVFCTMTTAPILDKSGNYQGAIAGVIDITERKRAEDKIRAAEENLKNTFELSPSIICKANLDTGYFIEANKAVTRILGYSVEEFISKPFIELIHPDDRKISTDEQDEQLKGKEIIFFENRYLCKDGTYKWMAWQGTKANDNGIVTAIASDITERKQTEKTLQETSFHLNERLKELNCLFEFSNLVQAQDISDDFFKEILDIMPPAFRDPESTVCRLIINGKEYKDQNFQKTDWNIYHDIIVNKRISGSIEVCRLKKPSELDSTQFLKEEKDLVKAIAERLGQIIGRNKSEKELIESEHRFRKMFENNSAVMLLIEPESGKILDSNNTASIFYGYTREELISMSIDEINTLNPEDVKKNMKLAESGKKNFFNFKHRLKNNNERDVQVHSTPIEYMNQKLLFSIIYDITESKLAEKNLLLSETRFRELINTMNSGVAIYKVLNDGTRAEDYIVQEFSKALSEPEGKSRDERIGKSLLAIKPNIVDFGLVPILREVWKTGKPAFYPAKQYVDDNLSGYYENKVFRLPSGEVVTVYDDVTERKRHLIIQETLFNISKALNTMDDLPVLFEKIKGFLGNVLDTTNFFIAMYDKESNTISLPYISNDKEAIVTFPVGKTLTRYVIESKKPLYAPKCVQEKLAAQGKIEFLGTMGKLWLGVPMIIGDNVIGAIAVQSYNDPNLYSEKDIEILSFISEEIALAIKHKIADDQIKRDLQEKTVLLQEIYHRTKNNMQVISSMLKIEARRSNNDSLKASFKDISTKINSMSLVHQKLYQAKDLSRINLRDYIADLLRMCKNSYSLQASNITLKLELEDVFVLIDTAIPLGLVLNELFTNVFKHAFPNSGKGELYLHLYQEEKGTINIHLADDGIGIPADLDLRESKSMGCETMFVLIESQLQGEVTYLVDKGLKWHLKFRNDRHKARI